MGSTGFFLEIDFSHEQTFKNLKEKMHILCILSVLKEKALNVLKLRYAIEAKFDPIWSKLL